MRDIFGYSLKYNNIMNSGFEKYKVYFRKRHILEHLPEKKAHILEIGCGTDPLFPYLNDYISYTIVEPCEEYVNLAREKKNNNNIEILKDFFPTDKLYNRRYDFIVCSGLLHEVESSFELLEGIYAHLDSNGIVRVDVPNANSLHRILGREMGLISDVHDMDESNMLLQQNRVYDIKTLTEECIEVGFKVVEKGSYFIKPFSHTQMYAMIENRIIDERAIEGLYNMSNYLPDCGSDIFVLLTKD